MVGEQRKRGAPKGGRWTALQTQGDAQRFFRWLILEVKADRMDLKKAAVLGQLGTYLLKSMMDTTESDLQRRLAEVEAALDSEAFHAWRNSNGYSQGISS